ncbi:bifunctional ornithine acetyltransferase/N-acetylglutamate synthase [Streptomyces sp. NPDC051286]|uniref:bifunctional ornithine acetyltransferase/N-acetylglutamate synthase n=1 Tax=Streptomyces sp. NPDC051286 TaxID=3365647 RepID=UPI0037B495F5
MWWPTGFRAYTGHGGLRKHGDDISIVASDRPTISAAMFTRSLFAGPAVVLSRAHAAGRNLRAVTTLAQNANVATGRRGEENAAEVVRRVAGILGNPGNEVLIGSTGVIGRPLPMGAIRTHLDETANIGLAAFVAGPIETRASCSRPGVTSKTSSRKPAAAYAIVDRVRVRPQMYAHAAVQPQVVPRACRAHW